MSKPPEGRSPEPTSAAEPSSLRRAEPRYLSKASRELAAYHRMSEEYLLAAAHLMRSADAITNMSKNDEVRRRIDELTQAALSELTENYIRTTGRNTKKTTTGLQNSAKSAINESRRNDMQRFEYPQPDEEAELGAIQERSIELVEVADSVANLGLEGVDVQVRVAGLHEIANRCEQLARNIGMHAVSEGNLTQRQLSRLLGVAELTVGRWVKAAQEQQDNPKPQDQ